MRGTIEDLATFFEVSLDMLCIRDLDLRLVRVNRAWEEVLGYPVEQLEGACMLDFIHPDDLPASRGHMDRIVEVEEIRGFVNRYRHRDGHYRFLEWRARKVGDLVFGLARDVTERVAFEQAINDAKLAAEAASQAKSDFLANMSHEIRTPLNGVIGLVDALGRTELAPSQRELVRMIESSGEILLRLVSDILDMSKIEAGRLEIASRKFHLRPELDGLFDVFGLRARDKGLVFTVNYGSGTAGVFDGDIDRIKQVLSNLLSNAIKFTDTGAVTVHVDLLDPAAAGGRWTAAFAVRDTGVGFTAAFASDLFSRFTQSDGTITRRFGGTGLGLAICKSLVDLMGGEITAESEPGQGSVFRVRVPLLPVQLPLRTRAAPTRSLGNEAGETTLEAKTTRRLKVLFAEDHPINQKVIQLFLGLHDTEVTTVENGIQALEAFRADRYDLILMDMQMPVMDGLTATRAIRDAETADGRARTPIIILSANAMSQHHLDAIAAGADLHVAKPVTAKTLTAGIDRVLGGSAPPEYQVGRGNFS